MGFGGSGHRAMEQSSPEAPYVVLASGKVHTSKPQCSSWKGW